MPDRPTAPDPSRLPVVVLVGAALVAGGLADRFVGTSGPHPAAPAEALPVAAPADALSSAWLCAGATGQGGALPGSIVVANTGTRALTARVTLVPEGGAHVELPPVTVAPGSTAAVAEQAGTPTGAVAAEVLLDGGAAAVDQVVAGSGGTSVTSCATSGSPTWFFAGGETLVNASDTVELFNPYAGDTIVDMSFGTDQGVEAPGDFQGIDVPAGSVVSVPLGSHLRRRTVLAATVRARIGRVVATSTEVVAPPAAGEAVIGAPPDPSNPTSADPADPVAGAVVSLGATAPTTSATWADGVTGNGLDERFEVYDPGTAPAAVTLAVHLDAGQAEPFTFTVPPGQVTVVDANAEARIPPGVGHTTTVTANRGVVTVRSVTAVAPAPLRGREAVAGDPVAARSWVLPAAAGPGLAGQVAVVDPGAAAATVRVSLLGPDGVVGVPATVVARPGGRVVVPIAAPQSGTDAVVVTADEPVTIESQLGGPTAAMLALGVPLG